MLRFLAVATAAAVTLPLALLAVVVAVPLWIVAALSTLVARLIEPAGEPWHRLVEFEPEIGWKPKGGLRTRGMVEDIFAVTTDAGGWRGRTALADSQVVVIGDSFAWGQGIDDRDFFADVAGNLRIKAIGANGYSMVQELLWLRRITPALPSRLVLWFVFLGNDLYDNLQPNLYHYRRPFVREKRTGSGWEIVTAHVDRSPWMLTKDWPYFERLADLCRDGFLADRAYAACDYLIDEGAAICAAAGAGLTVVTIPDRAQLTDRDERWIASWAPEMMDVDAGVPDDRIAAICASRDVGFLPLRSVLRRAHYKRDDLHWTAAGHRRVAEVIAELHRRWERPRPPLAITPSSGPIAARSAIGA